MTRKKAIALAIGAIAVGAAVRHCVKTMARSCAKGEAIDLCSRATARGSSSGQPARAACSETAALAA